MSYSNLVFPFAVEEEGREKVFSESMEAALILCITEAERKKSGLFRGKAEKLHSISKLYYPIWAVPWKVGAILVDGMDTFSKEVQYYKPPEIEPFIEQLQRCMSNQELFRNSLRSHTETFSDFTTKTESSIKAWVTDKEFSSDLIVYSKKAKLDDDSKFSLLLPTIIKDTDADKIKEQIEKYYSMVESDIRVFKIALDTLNKDTRIHVSKIEREKEEIKEDFETSIQETAKEVEKRKGELEEELERKVDILTKSNQKEVESQLRAKARLEQELTKLEQNKSEYETRRELRIQKKDKVGEARWDAKLQRTRNQVSITKAKIRSTRKFIDKTKRETEKTRKKLEDTYEKLMDKEDKKITALENIRDLEIAKKQKLIEELDSEAHVITKKIKKLVERKQEQKSILKESTVPLKIQRPTLLKIPLYIIKYDEERGQRYFFLQPIIIKKTRGIGISLRKTLKSYSLQSKISTFIKPSLKMLDKFLFSVKKRLREDRTLQRFIENATKEHNLFDADISEDFTKLAERGMVELEEEGWIKPEEKTKIIQTCSFLN